MLEKMQKGHSTSENNVRVLDEHFCPRETQIQAQFGSGYHNVAPTAVYYSTFHLFASVQQQLDDNSAMGGTPAPQYQKSVRTPRAESCRMIAVHCSEQQRHYPGIQEYTMGGFGRLRLRTGTKVETGLNCPQSVSRVFLRKIQRR